MTLNADTTNWHSATSPMSPSLFSQDTPSTLSSMNRIVAGTHSSFPPLHRTSLTLDTNVESNCEMRSFVYMFGFAQLIPQLIINYKLKSVAHMPIKACLLFCLFCLVTECAHLVFCRQWFTKRSGQLSMTFSHSVSRSVRTSRPVDVL